MSAIDIETADGVTVLRPGKRLSMVNAPQLISAVETVVQQGRAKLIVDLGATEFVDSSGLGALVSCLKKARQAGGDLKLCAVGEQVQMVLDLTNLSRVLRPRATVAEAVAEFG